MKIKHVLENSSIFKDLYHKQVQYVKYIEKCMKKKQTNKNHILEIQQNHNNHDKREMANGLRR